jgi:hypothetical protein
VNFRSDTLLGTRFWAVNVGLVVKVAMLLHNAVALCQHDLDTTTGVLILCQVNLLLAILACLACGSSGDAPPGEYIDLEMAGNNSPLDLPFLNRLLFTWMFSLVALGARQPLEKEDAYDLSDINKTNIQKDLFDEILTRHMARGSKNGLIMAILERFRGRMVVQVVLVVFQTLLDI